MHTQVGIIGAGPAGLFLAHLLYREGIDCVVLEARSRAYVEDRVRAGVLEQGTVDLMAELGLDQRLRRECMIDEAIDIRFGNGKLIHVHFPELVAGKVVTIYGQQEVVKDLIAARLADGGRIEFDAEVTALEGLDTDRPTIRYRQHDTEHTLTCDIVAGCDGFHGIARGSIPGGCAHHLRSRVSVRLAGHSVGVAADQGDDLRQSRQRLCAVQPPLAQDLAPLRAGRGRRGCGELVRRPLLERAASAHERCATTARSSRAASSRRA